MMWCYLFSVGDAVFVPRFSSVKKKINEVKYEIRVNNVN